MKEEVGRRRQTPESGEVTVSIALALATPVNERYRE
jgi:hypothetical protein